MASEGIKFLDAHSPCTICSPSRYGLLSGQLVCRTGRRPTAFEGPGGPSYLAPDKLTVAQMLQQRGYRTGVFGKWHLGLGPVGGPNWNGKIEHGPLDIGFKEAFILPATGDRVPCVYIENDHVRNLNAQDPIEVNYLKKIGQQPTGKENPELLKMKHSHGHDNTIVNGVGRIGFMVGGKQALWDDEDMAQTLANKAKAYMVRNQKNPFFLYFATHDIHVPRIPNSKFLGKSGFGNRGDALLQLDDSVGQLMKTLDSLHLTSNTLVILTSDNGPVVDDGYIDGSKENLGLHQPAGILRGGKYSSFEAGTRVPFIVKWPKKVSVGKSNALISQIDFLATMNQLLGTEYNENSAKDSKANLNAWLGKDKIGREYIIEQAGTLAIKKGDWKFIKSGKGARLNPLVNIELGNDSEDQLYNLKTDPTEKNNVSTAQKEKSAELKSLLEQEMNK
jgi:arylsulfatase A-like enzyme